MSILKREDAQTIANILNKKQSILVMKQAPKNGKGCWWYLYCSENGKDLLIEKCSRKALFVNHLHDIYGEKDILNCKVVARFWCDKVEYIEATYDEYNYGEDDYATETLRPETLYDESCVSREQMFNYLGLKGGYAIHISKLEIFDRQKELKHFYYEKLFHRSEPDEDGRKTFKALMQLSKAPTNYCYVEEA